MSDLYSVNFNKKLNWKALVVIAVIFQLISKFIIGGIVGVVLEVGSLIAVVFGFIDFFRTRSK